jgi:hypothetical protein
LQISLFVISEGELLLRDLTLSSHIQVLKGAAVKCTNVFFAPPPRRTDPVLDILNRSRISLHNCKFLSPGKAALSLRTQSRADVTSCFFEGDSNTTILEMEKSALFLSDCEFRENAKFSVYATDPQSKTEIRDCRFLTNGGKGILGVKRSIVTVVGCTFQDLIGGITVAECSQLEISNSRFQTLKGTCILSTRNSQFQVSNCSFEGPEGNGIQIESSKGNVMNCNFRECSFPPIAVYGVASDPIISDCAIAKCGRNGIVAREGCSPRFLRVSLRELNAPAIAVSDYSRAYFWRCKVEKIEGQLIVACTAAEPTFVECQFECAPKVPLFSMLTESRVSFRKNVFAVIEKRIKIRAEEIKADDFIENRIDFNGKKRRLDLLHRVVGDEMDDPEFVISEDGYEIEPGIRGDPNDSKISSKIVGIPEFCPHGGEIESCVCLRCNQEKAEWMCSPCGHLVLCRKCAEEKVKICPLCFANVTGSSLLIRSDNCVLFPEELPVVACLPCGHLCLSLKGMRKQGAMEKCRVCQNRVTAFRYQFPVQVPPLIEIDMEEQVSELSE